MRYLFSFLIVLLLLTSCNKYKKPMPCMPPPPSISFRFVDNDNKDLFATGVLDQSKITIKDETSKSFQYRIQGNDTIRVIAVSIGGNEGNHAYKLTTGDKSVDFSMNIVRGKCGYYIKEEKIISPSSFAKTPVFYVIKFP